MNVRTSNQVHDAVSDQPGCRLEGLGEQSDEVRDEWIWQSSRMCCQTIGASLLHNRGRWGGRCDRLQSRLKYLGRSCGAGQLCRRALGRKADDELSDSVG